METKNFYEVHVTVSLLQSKKELFDFKNICTLLKVKPIVIDLEKNSTVVQEDVMTSSKYFGYLEDVKTFTWTLSRKLNEFGFVVLRLKIESEPSHSFAPQKPGDIMPSNAYFESHISFLCRDKDSQEKLRLIATKNNAHISNNPFKIFSDDSKIIMITLRDYISPFSIFSNNVKNIIEKAKEFEFIPHKNKVEVEFAVYDSNWKHDIVWF
jgi:hypothetical protein